jgi:hypothetical protein
MSTREMIKRDIDVLPDESLANVRNLIRLFIKYSKPINEKFEEFTNQLENEGLLTLAENRINAYGGWEAAEKHFISESEFMSKIGVTEADIKNAEDVDLI